MRTSKLNQSNDRDAAQMLLATGVVLLMSLLSMAIFGVKVAGLTLASRLFKCCRYGVTTHGAI